MVDSGEYSNIRTRKTSQKRDASQIRKWELKNQTAPKATNVDLADSATFLR